MNLYASIEKGDDTSKEFTPIVVFIAFSIESYLNSLGARQLVFWDEIERLPWRNKIEILHKVSEKTCDWGKEPLQFATEVFRIRDKLAHGKSERVTGTVETDYGRVHATSIGNSLEPGWYLAINRDWIVQAKARFRQLMIYLGRLFDYHESDHLELASGGVLTRDERET